MSSLDGISALNAIIAKCVDDIWSDYDQDGNGHLDREETKEFVIATLNEMSDDGQVEFSDEDFKKCFREFDKDGNGTIDKVEMATFIKKVAGLA